MLRMAVCDKEEETCSLIKALAEESIGCKVWTFHSDTELLESKEKYDILLLDIGNGEPTGIETARKIRRCYDPILIFIAEGKKHVLVVFDVEAFHYLLKPIDEEKLKEVLKRAENRRGLAGFVSCRGRHHGSQSRKSKRRRRTGTPFLQTPCSRKRQQEIRRSI